MKVLATNDHEDYYSGIICITVNGKNAYELKGKFLDDFHNNAFDGTNIEEAVKHIEYFLRIVDSIDLPNVNHDKILVVVFPISLVGGARRWFDKIKESIDSWTLRDSNLMKNLRMTGSMNGTKIYHGLMRNLGLTLEYGKNQNQLNILASLSTIKLDVRNGQQYEALEDNELKEDALRNKVIMEGLIDDDNDDESHHEADEREELCEAHELPVCNMRRFKMIKYSFGQDEEYVAFKEDKYDNLTRTSIDARRAYQEIYRVIDEGWMVTIAE
ncbi:hypothetical protein Tco_1373414 [Tanacetum coccineum]